MANTAQREAQGTILSPEDVERLRAQGQALNVAWEPNPAQLRMLHRNEDEIFYGGGKYGGKGSPLSEPVLTPYGFRPMGEIVVGSTVSNPDGGCAKVFAVHPLGKRKLWRFTFNDGSSTRVTDDHLWLTRWNAQKWKGKERTSDDNGWRICQTSEMIRRFKARKGDFTYQIPRVKPMSIRCSPKMPAIEIDPYVFGVMIGDGYLGKDGVKLTTIDPEIREEIFARTGHELTRHGTRGLEWGVPKIAGVFDGFKKLGLIGKRAWEKSIPTAYLHQSPENRWLLLQG